MDDEQIGKTAVINQPKPSGYLNFMNIKVALFGNLPNKFQRWMIKKVFAIDIVEVDEDE